MPKLISVTKDQEMTAINNSVSIGMTVSSVIITLLIFAKNRHLWIIIMMLIVLNHLSRAFQVQNVYFQWKCNLKASLKGYNE
jgi:O-antigen/teichoic acid export membrane protein